jgi:hypothetical protein
LAKNQIYRFQEDVFKKTLNAPTHTEQQQAAGSALPAASATSPSIGNPQFFHFASQSMYYCHFGEPKP